MRNGGPECPAHEARYTATMEFLPKAAKKKTRVEITIGGQLADTNVSVTWMKGRMDGCVNC